MKSKFFSHKQKTFLEILEMEEDVHFPPTFLSPEGWSERHGPGHGPPSCALAHAITCERQAWR